MSHACGKKAGSADDKGQRYTAGSSVLQAMYARRVERTTAFLVDSRCMCAVHDKAWGEPA